MSGEATPAVSVASGKHISLTFGSPFQSWTEPSSLPVPQTSMMSDSMSSDVFKPTRRVREAPVKHSSIYSSESLTDGRDSLWQGGRSSNIFGDPDVPDDEFNAQFNGSRNVAAPPPALPETKEVRLLFLDRAAHS